MTSRHTTRSMLLGALGALSLLAASCGDDEKTTDTTAAPETTMAAETTMAPETTMGAETTMAPETTEMAVMYEGELIGTFTLDAGDCTDGTVTGSWFQMVQPGGTADAGPFVPNGDSLCTSDPNYSLLTPGEDGGLFTGTAQNAPDPAFDETGNGQAASIFLPVKFFGVDFAGAIDGATAPAASAAGGVLTVDMTGFTAYYGAGMFSQGAEATGSIDPMTGAFELDWSSLISGGSFDGFMGVWHFEGTFVPA